MVMRVNEHQFTGEAGAPQVARDQRADRARPRGRADQRDRLRLEQLVEVTNRHSDLCLYWHAPAFARIPN